MPVGTFAANLSLHFGRPATVCTGDVLFLLGLGFHSGLFLFRAAFVATSKGDATHNDGINVIASVHDHGLLMVEQAHTGEGHGNTVLVAGVDDMVVAYGTTGLCHILYTTLVGAFNVVTEGEECVAS